MRVYERRFTILEESAETTAHLLRLAKLYQPGAGRIHDLNIVATMQTYGVKRLLTNNGNDFKHYVGQLDVIELF